MCSNKMKENINNKAFKSTPINIYDDEYGPDSLHTSISLITNHIIYA